MEKCRRLAEAVLLIEKQVIEPAISEELDHRRGSEHGPAAERAPACGEAPLQCIRAEHRPKFT
jgi:hypothetical protein